MLVHIKLALAARGMRQADLAQRLGITQSALSEIINGRRTAIPALADRIARALDANREWLFSPAAVPELVSHGAEDTAAAPAS